MITKLYSGKVPARKFLIGIVLPLLSCLFWHNSFSSETAQKDVTVYQLQLDGWEIYEVISYEEILAGLSPYEDLIRVVLVTTYVLRYFNKEIVCSMYYDSQLDNYEEQCGESYTISDTAES